MKRLKYELDLLTSLNMTCKLVLISPAVLSSTQNNAPICISLNSYDKVTEIRELNYISISC